MFGHHDPSEPKEKKKKKELHRFTCPDDRELDDIIEGSQGNCVSSLPNFLNSSNSSRSKMKFFIT